jgi:phosphoribosylanthranilate isomerase
LKMGWKGRFKVKAGYKVKICGTTNMQDALLAAGAGADYFGVVVEVDFSPRSLTIEAAKELFSSPPIPAVALVFRMTEDRLRYLAEKLNPFAIQFLSQEPPELIKKLKQVFLNIQLWQSIHLPQSGNVVNLPDIKQTVVEYLQAGVDLILYDTAATVNGVRKFGGTGLCSDWNNVTRLMREIKSDVPVLLAGGINPGNAADAIIAVNPDGIDLCSGVELVRGKKDEAKVKALMKAVKEIDWKRRNR